MDRNVGEIQLGEPVILSLEWRIPHCPADTTAEVWRQDWLNAWFSVGTETLAGYRKQGVLIVHSLLVEAADAGEATACCQQARELYRTHRRGLTESARRFVHHYLTSLSEVPVEDIEHFLDVHYRLSDYHPELDPYEVAQWVHDETGGSSPRRSSGWSSSTTRAFSAPMMPWPNLRAARFDASTVVPKSR